MTAEQRTHIRRARDAHARTRQLPTREPRLGLERGNPNRWTHRPKWGHCTYCGVSRIRGTACAKHKDLVQLDIGEARG